MIMYSYVDVLKNPSLPFQNNKIEEIKTNKEIIDLTFEDFFKLLKFIENK